MILSLGKKTLVGEIKEYYPILEQYNLYSNAA